MMISKGIFLKNEQVEATQIFSMKLGCALLFLEQFYLENPLRTFTYKSAYISEYAVKYKFYLLNLDILWNRSTNRCSNMTIIWDCFANEFEREFDSEIVHNFGSSKGNKQFIGEEKRDVHCLTLLSKSWVQINKWKVALNCTILIAFIDGKRN